MSKGDVDVGKEITLNILDGFVEGCPQVVDADEDRATQHERKQSQAEPKLAAKSISQRQSKCARDEQGAFAHVNIFGIGVTANAKVAHHLTQSNADTVI